MSGPQTTRVTRVSRHRADSRYRGGWRLAVLVGLALALEAFTLPLDLGPGSATATATADPAAPVLQQVVPHGEGYLEDPLVAVVLLGGGLLFAVITVSYRRSARRLGLRHPRARLHLAIASLAAAALLVGGTAAGVNAYVGYVPDLPALLSLGQALRGDAVSSIPIDFPGEPLAWRTRRFGPQLLHVPLGDPARNIPARWTYIFTPPGYNDPANADRRYPVIYLLHGFPGTSTDWFRAGGAGRTADVLLLHRSMPAAVIVSPESNGGSLTQDYACLDAADPGGPQLAGFLTGTVVDYVDAHFRTIPERRARAIGGMSAGAYCALNLGLHNPGKFGSIIALTPYGDPGADGRALLGNSKELIEANTPARYLPRLGSLAGTTVFLSAGTRDRQAMATMGELARGLRGADADVVTRTVPSGRDTWAQARLDLSTALTVVGPRLATG